ncbi:MAG: lipid-A-disaccharide synthase [Bacteroidales bacterium]|nr:lipid-A-disaccharide synthase [Bacteroidales bacterium]
MKYYIIAGEASGDLHGANLMRALLRRDPSAEIRFWGGDDMASVGGTCVKHIRDLAFMGFLEVAAHLRTVLGNIALCKKDIEAFGPDAIIYIDYPGFNLKIAKWAHRKGYRNFHYISPQLWAWKKGRIKNMRRDLDALYYILPFEQKFYAANNMPQAHFVGHPLLDAVPQLSRKADTMTAPDERPIIALLPGSRRMELKNMLPIMLRIAAHHPEYRFVIGGMSLLGEQRYHPYLIRATSNVEIVYDQTYALLSQAHAALICSGTATLETALFDVPQVVCYAGNPLSYIIARAFVGKRIRYISLVNLIADKPILTELLQGGLNENRLENEFNLIAKDEAYRKKMLDGYDEVRSLLGGTGASDRTAEMIVKAIKNVES